MAILVLILPASHGTSQGVPAAQVFASPRIQIVGPGPAFAMVSRIDDENEKASRNTSLRDRALEAIRKHNFSEAESLIHEGRKTRSGRKKDQWRIVEARLELERNEYAKAGLIAMQVVLLRPKSDEVATALYWTAKAYEGLGRPAKAIQLYEECRAHKTAPDSLIKVVNRRIDALRESQVKP
jgi:predicted Zn-dependent protease